MSVDDILQKLTMKMIGSLFGYRNHDGVQKTATTRAVWGKTEPLSEITLTVYIVEYRNRYQNLHTSTAH